MTTVLVVEDEFVTGHDIRTRLTELGYDVPGFVITGEDAIVAAGKIRPHIVLMDITLGGKMDGTETAAVIRQRYNIPVIYLSAHTDEATLIKAARTEPFGYLTKPLDDKVLKVTIEMALYTHAMEQKVDALSPALGARTLFLKKALGGITVLLYTRDVNRFPLFKHLIEDGLSNNIGCLYAFKATPLLQYFARPVAEKELAICNLNEGVGVFSQWFDRHTRTSPAGYDPAKKVFCIADFSGRINPDALLHIKKKFVEADDPHTGSFSGIIAVPLDELDKSVLDEIFKDSDHHILLSGKENLISFSSPVANPIISDAVSQEIMDTVVSKSLEVLILSSLTHPVTGFEILREIEERFHVRIPIARVYTYLYELEKSGVITATVKGRARMYLPTKSGAEYIKGRLAEITTAYEYVLRTQQ